MDDPDDLYDLRSFDALSGIDLTLWLRLVLGALVVLLASAGAAVSL